MSISCDEFRKSSEIKLIYRKSVNLFHKQQSGVKNMRTKWAEIQERKKEK